MVKENMNELSGIKMANSAAFGRYIRQLREARGITMADLSRETGIPYHSITAFEASGHGGKGAISAEKAQVLYDYLQTLPVAKRPLRTKPGYPAKKRKHCRAKVAKQTTEVKETPQPVEEKTMEQKPEDKLEALKCKQIHNLHDLIQAADIRAFAECRHLIAEIDNKQTPDVVRTVDVQQLVTLVNFLKENWGYLK